MQTNKNMFAVDKKKKEQFYFPPIPAAENNCR